MTLQFKLAGGVYVTQRRHQRVPVNLIGRYMLQSREEHPCETVNISPGGMLLIAPVKAQIGERVIVYLDSIGRFAGTAVRQESTGFAMSMNLPPAKRDKLADHLTWLANRDSVGLPEARKHERFAPLMQRSMLRLPNGTEHMAKIKDISILGVGIETDVLPALESPIVIGKTPAKVVRHFDGGFAAEFTQPFAVGMIDELTRL
jgi:hypothetical protein